MAYKPDETTNTSHDAPSQTLGAGPAVSSAGEENGIPNNPFTLTPQAGQSTPPGIPEYMQYQMDLQRTEQEARQFAERLRLKTEARELLYNKEYRDIGRFIITRNNNYLSNKWAVELPQHHLGFDVDGYPLFDKEIADTLHINAVRNRRHMDYQDFYYLRQNIAIVRNVVYRQMFPDGEYNPDNPSDRQKKLIIADMGAHLGKMLRRKGGLLSGPSISLEEANREDVGAAAIYKELQALQAQHLGFPFRFLNGVFGGPKFHWHLKPIEQTALSRKSMQQYWDVIEANAAYRANAGVHDTLEPSEAIEKKANLLSNIAHEVLDVAQNRRPEDMPAPEQMMSVELAETILEKFKIHLKAASQVVGPDLDVEIFRYSQYLAELSTLYANNLVLMTQRDPALKENADFMRQAREASVTIGKVSHILNIKAQRFYAEEGNYAKLKSISDKIMAPGHEDWENVRNDNLALLGEDLVKHVEKLNGALNRQHEVMGPHPTLESHLQALQNTLDTQKQSSHAYQSAHQANVQQQAAQTAQNLKNTWSSGHVAQGSKQYANTIKQMASQQPSQQQQGQTNDVTPRQR